MTDDSPFDRLLTAVLALVGVTALTLALAVALVPGLVPAPLVDSVLVPVLADPVLVVVAAAVLVGVTGYQVAFGGDGTTDRPNVTVPTVPSAVESERIEVDTPGDWVDERLAKVAGDEPVEGRVGLAIVKRRVRERLTEVAVDVITDTEDCSARRAHEKIEAGSWTDRPRARVLLGGPDVESLPLSVRVRDWASGEAFERQVQATVEELADMAGVDTGASLAPEPASLATDGTTEAETGTDWQPSRDPRSEEWASEFDTAGLYRREMFEDAQDLDLDGESETDREQNGTTEPIETAGEKA